MIAARTTTQAAAPAPRRDLVGKLLLTGIEYSDARPWIGAAGLIAMYVLAGVLEQLL
ncbi:hypothetical protein [Massilia phyllosphaerae]|uniref:hypothetical protein n=1 Tax=Massilia phyllosphaerae TaxID=3106034 RepID=UPI002B1CB80B|nr:hypothetical protein [Massilia sp. SGZ-792]